MSIGNRLGSDLSFFDGATSSRQRLVDACCDELRQRGIAWDPRCPVEDLLRASLDQHTLLPPADFPAGEAAYWAKFEGLLRDPRWQRCRLKILLTNSSQRREAGAAVLVLGLLGATDFFCRGSNPKPTDQGRAQLGDVPELSLSPQIELMVGVATKPTSDHRMLDSVAVSLYQAALPLDLQDDIYLTARLQELRRLMRGLRPGDDSMAVSGLYGVTFQGADLTNVVPTEMADKRLFAVKYANGELMYWLRVSPSEEVPRVRFRAFVDQRLTTGCVGAGGHSLMAWAKALGLWFCHDLLCHVALQSWGIQYEFELSIGDTDGVGPVRSFVFKLHDLFDEFGGQIALDQPFLTQLPSVQPFVLRGQSLNAGDGTNGLGNEGLNFVPFDISTIASAHQDGSAVTNDPDRRQPIFCFDLFVSSADSAAVRPWTASRHETKRYAALRLTEKSCELASEHASGAAVTTCCVDRLCDIRRLVLRRVVDQMLTTVTSL